MDCDECNDLLLKALPRAAPAKLLQAIALAYPFIRCNKAGETAPPICMQCSDEGAVGLSRAYTEAPPGRVVLCANRLRSSEVEEALVHELVHLYDHCRGADLKQCNQLAASEVRAAREAECHVRYKGESSLPHQLSSFLHKRCVVSKAKLSTRSMFPGNGGCCVDAVFEEAVADMEPFVSE
ncbi:unnamed protein product [Chrysoparadoxa australica]